MGDLINSQEGDGTTGDIELTVEQLNVTTLEYERIEGIKGDRAVRFNFGGDSSLNVSFLPDGSGLMIQGISSSVKIEQISVEPKSTNLVHIKMGEVK